MQPLIARATHLSYVHVLKPFFFLFPAELVHTRLVAVGRFGCRLPLVAGLLRWAWAYQHPQLSKTFHGVTFPNPIGLAAGFDYNGDLVETLPHVGFGFHTIGSVTLEPYGGNPPPRLSRFPKSKALLINKGLKNVGARAIIKRLKKYTMTIPVGISIASTNKLFANEAQQIEDMLKCFRLFEKSGLNHSYYELNISCPNTFGGEPFTTPEKLQRLMKKMDSLQLRRPLFVKMPIDQAADQTLAMLRVLADHAVEGVIFGNLTKDKTNPAVEKSERAQWKTRRGNVSGKPTWHRSNACIKLTKKHFDGRFTIIGVGGVFSGQDAAEKMRLGADLIQLITGMIYEGPEVIGEINQYLHLQSAATSR